MVPKNVFRRQDNKVLSLPPHQVWVPDNGHWDNSDLQVLKISVVMCSTVPIRFQTYSGFPEPPVFGVMPVPPEYAVPHPPVLSVPVSFFFWYRSITHQDISVTLPHTALPVQGMTFGFPEPDTPAIPTSLFSGISTLICFRLWTCAFRILITFGWFCSFIFLSFPYNNFHILLYSKSVLPVA